MQFRDAISQKAIVRIWRYAPHFEGLSLTFNMQYKFLMEIDSTAFGKLCLVDTVGEVKPE